MGLKVFQPHALLTPYIAAFWDYDDLLGDQRTALSILPDTATYLCFLYADRLTTTHKDRIYTTRSGLAGFQTFRSDLGGLGNISGVSARLTPWGLNVFCRGIAKDCAEKRVDCRDIFPVYTVEAIEEQLSRQQTAEARVKYIEQFLLSRLNRSHEDLWVQAACKKLNADNGNHSIATLAKTLGLSERSLERRFQTHIGISPKKYARIVRLRSAIFKRAQLSSWAEAAYAAGYYDQSHLINDFQTFYGLSPDAIYPQMQVSKTLRFSGLLNLRHA